MNRKIVISRNTAWSLYNFHSGLIKALIKEGYQVVAVAPDDEYTQRLKNCGCRFIALPMDNHGTHPGRDLLLLLQYLRLLRRERPAIYLGYTIKPNVYGSLAAQALGIRVVNNISGLGVTFLRNNLLTKIVRSLYKLALYRSTRVFFQNAEDQELFVKAGLVRREATDRVPGSGIDLTKYQPGPPPGLTGRPFRFLLAARMIKHKGIGDFVKGAKIVRRRFPETEFQLLGFLNPRDPNAISVEELTAWQDEGVIRYLGETDDVRPYLANADCAVLPSGYPEGVPRSLLEAAAMARPIITTDTVGCRNVVDDGVNGFLCRKANPEHLAEKMMQVIGLTPERRLKMGNTGRCKVEREFDENIVIRKYVDTIAGILNQKTGGSKRKNTGFAVFDD